MPERSPAPAADAAAVAACLALVNTLSGRPTPSPVEGLTSYARLLEWARETGVLRPKETAALLRARRRPAEEASVLAQVIELRELVHVLLAAAAADRAPSGPILARLSEYLGGWYARSRLTGDPASLAWTYAGGDDPDRVLWELAGAASRLVGSAALRRVRPCAADDCGWWFVDDTKNHTRRWCDMTLCGNRAKVRRYREKRA